MLMAAVLHAIMLDNMRRSGWLVCALRIFYYHYYYKYYDYDSIWMVRVELMVIFFSPLEIILAKAYMHNMRKPSTR